MIRKLELNSERVAATGSIIATGVMKVLGQPNMEPLAVLVREAVQNSWDARTDAQGGVSFGLHGWTLSGEQRSFLRKNVLASRPEKSLPELGKHLESSSPLHVLAVQDRGTMGLGGPTRADVLKSGEPNDFVDFLRNVGQPSEKTLSGGTYGYGKAAFYRASQVRTILAYTRCKYQGRTESRFIGAGLGAPFEASDERFTGRHWWGEIRKKVAEPILNEDADRFAAGLGIPVFAEDETGTTVVVLQPAFGAVPNGLSSRSPAAERTPQQAFDLMIEQILLNFWPKMLSYERSGPAIRFEASWEGAAIPIPKPEEHPPLKGFVCAMHRLKGHSAPPTLPYRSEVKKIKSQRPTQNLGVLSIQQHPVEWSDSGSSGEGKSAFSGLTHHTALMRQAELVVKYLNGEPFAAGGWGYFGVFITDKEVDSVFAEAEPPTHDDWVSKGLENSWHRRYVNVALREIEAAMAEFAQPPTPHGAVQEQHSLAAFADMLGQSILPAEKGPSAAVPGPEPLPPDGARGAAGGAAGGGNGSEGGAGAGGAAGGAARPTAGRAHLRIIDQQLTVLNGQAALEIRFTAQPASRAQATAVHARAAVVLDGGYEERDPPIGAEQPQVLLWRSAKGAEVRDEPTVKIPPNDTGEWSVFVSLPKDAAIDVNLNVEASR